MAFWRKSWSCTFCAFISFHIISFTLSFDCLPVLPVLLHLLQLFLVINTIALIAFASNFYNSGVDQHSESFIVPEVVDLGMIADGEDRTEMEESVQLKALRSPTQPSAEEVPIPQLVQSLCGRQGQVVGPQG